jgi:hypothetical protein
MADDLEGIRLMNQMKRKRERETGFGREYPCYGRTYPYEQIEPKLEGVDVADYDSLSEQEHQRSLCYLQSFIFCSYARIPILIISSVWGATIFHRSPPETLRSTSILHFAGFRT